MSRSYAVTYDYRCPFARNAHEAVLAALADGADHEVNFRPFLLDEPHVEDGDLSVFDRPEDEWGSGLLALMWSVAVRDNFSDHFLAWHATAFRARHEHGREMGADEVLADLTAEIGLDPQPVADVVASGTPLATVASEHRELVKRHDVFGVPTFVAGDEAVFVRFMESGRVDDLERALDMLSWSRLNEFKRTRLPH